MHDKHEQHGIETYHVAEYHRGRMGEWLTYSDEEESWHQLETAIEDAQARMKRGAQRVKVWKETVLHDFNN